ncbi:unnamed protein product [Durusdinium trenchii]|uniref:O(6)-methylguanine-induced apoptosis 2 (MAPO2) (Sperm-tail PG-rich repeat-containing protein 1) n=2 Tax=Durusdinium trenchii TaxID=1381693 RepID=A0ABP0SET3_9DINO
MANGTPVADVTSPEPTVSFESQTTAVEAEMAEAQKMKSGQNMGESRHPTSPSRNTRSEMERSVPTIPSRYAVTLIKGNREYKGFNSRAMRFEVERQVDGPGPGSYGERKTFHQEFTERPGWGARGTSGFASKARRFGMRSMPSMPPPGLGCPGPGAYNALGALHSTKERKNFNKAGASANFNPSKNGQKVPPSSRLPGPGQYDPRMLPTAREAAAAQAAFNSSSTRLKGDLEPSGIPGPGEYYDGMARPVGYVPEYHQGLDMRMPTFKERHRPHITKIHHDLPAASAKARSILGSFGDEVSRECLGTQGLQVALPGPGHYEQELSLENSVSSVCASAFKDGPKRTDWAPEELSCLPGPGKYEPKGLPMGRLTSAKSAFISASERNKLQLSSVPGPAYYNPSLPKLQKSFRLKSGTFVL